MLRLRSLRTACAFAALLTLAAGALALPRGEESPYEHPYETDADRVPELRTGGSAWIRDVVIHTAVGPAFRGDVLVLDGKIEAVGEVTAPEGIVVLEGGGRHLAPGVVDCHSHTAIERGINEGTVAITAEVRISDEIDADDPAIYRGLAGGVTTALLLHGSANPIGGQDAIVKFKFHRRAHELLFPDAPRGIKFALGENVKRSNWGRNTDRFPASRMGVAAVYERAFRRAREYQAEWAEYRRAAQAGEDPAPPRSDVRLDVLAAILDDEVLVHCHCYRADEILMILRTAQRFGFPLRTLQHVLEGYKVAYEMAEAGVGGSTFGDWWAYKVEAYDAIPQNAALMHRAGVLSSVNSDSDEMMRRLYGEAAKSVRYAGIDARVGSIEVGKDADLVLLTGDPLSSLSRVEWTMVDGEIEFQRRDAFGLDGAELPVEPLSDDLTPLAADPDGPEPIALVGGTVHLLSGEAVENGTVLMQGERILAVGRDVAIPAGARVVSVDGKHVWPGMIALATSLGLREIGSVRATIDTSEIGGNQPDLRVAPAIHADSAHIGVTRSNGITRAQVAPQGGGPMRGRSAVVRLAGDTWEEMLDLDADMLHISFPRVPNTTAGKGGKKEVPEAVEELKRLCKDAREYARLLEEARTQGTPPPAYDPRLEALVPYVLRQKRVALHARNAQTILYALRFAREEELDAVLFGATEAWKVADAIAAEGVPVVVGPVLTLPGSRFDPYDAPFANAAVLHRAGVEFAIMPADEENTRNAPFHAAMACAFGLPHEEAVRAVTYYPARILGLEERLGSLAPGKTADVVVTTGDLLEITSRVEYLFIDGRQQDLSNRQTRLYERFAARLSRLLEAARDS